jgi:precorrin-6Y C5,15-methyltransferase (decarboxylating)
MINIYVIGIGYKPLEKRLAGIIERSAVILASPRLHEVFLGYPECAAAADRLRVINNVNETIGFMKCFIKENPDSTITLLASGDPMFFGIGRRAVEEFGKDSVEIIPDLSSVQRAFSLIKEPWDDALLISLHGGPDPNRRRKPEYGLDDIPLILDKRSKIAILTDGINNPSVIAARLVSRDDIRIYVCEKLGYPEERVAEGSPREIAAQTFADPNVVIIKTGAEVLKKDNCADIRLGLGEDEIAHSRGLITKDEVRAAAIHKLRLPSEGVLWDIGAGSGSISIEASRLCPELRIFAIEKNQEQINNIKSNINKFAASKINLIEGIAPDVLAALPSPERVFIGGSGGRISEIIESLSARIQSGIVVINAATIETFTAAYESLAKEGYSVEAVQISVAKMKPIGGNHSFSAQNPVFVVRGKR